MTLSAALPTELKSATGTILTVVVPAPNGCNLTCPFCYIEQRKEPARRADLAPSDYVQFIEEIAANRKVVAICIQGYEPLLPEAFGYTKAILATAREYGIASTLITNGTLLKDWVSELESSGLRRLFVSLDADNAQAHDRQRGKVGAFDATVAGLRCVSQSSVLKAKITVVSVLISKKRGQLMGIPALLNSLGLDRWIVDPLVKVGKNNIGGPKSGKEEICRDALAIKHEADKHGIKFIVDDEFDRLSHGKEIENAIYHDARDHLNIQRLWQPGNVYRLMPNGQMSIGHELLREVVSNTPRWIPNQMSAVDFIRSTHDR